MYYEDFVPQLIVICHSVLWFLYMFVNNGRIVHITEPLEFPQEFRERYGVDEELGVRFVSTRTYYKGMTQVVILNLCLWWGGFYSNLFGRF